MDKYKEIGVWLVTEARISYKYWHSSYTCRFSMSHPFFDRTQCEWILKEFKEENEDNVA